MPRKEKEVKKVQPRPNHTSINPKSTEREPKIGRSDTHQRRDREKQAFHATLEIPTTSRRNTPIAQEEPLQIESESLNKNYSKSNG